MRFDEFQLYEAVCEVYQTMAKPRSEAWLINADQKEELMRRIQQALPMGYPYDPQQWLEAWLAFGKSPTVEGDVNVKRWAFAVHVGQVHGVRCFYANRGLGKCSPDLEIDRLVPGIRGGKYTIENCVLACSFHNAQKNAMNIEDYLSTAKQIDPDGIVSAIEATT